MKIHNHKIIVVYDKKITLTFMITLKSMLHKNQTKKLKTPSLFNVFLPKNRQWDFNLTLYIYLLNHRVDKLSYIYL